MAPEATVSDILWICAFPFLLPPSLPAFSLLSFLFLIPFGFLSFLTSLCFVQSSSSPLPSVLTSGCLVGVYGHHSICLLVLWAKVKAI